MMQRMNPRDGLARIRDALDLYHVLKTPRCLGAASPCRLHVPGVSRISGEHDRVAAADGAAIDNRGVDADVHCVVLSSRPQNS